MRGTLVLWIQRTMESSSLFQFARRVAAGSVLCAGIVTIVRRLRRDRHRIIVGLGGEWSEVREARSAEHIAALTRQSRFVAILSSVVNMPFDAWPESGVARKLECVFRLDLNTRFRLIGWIIATSVITHVVLLGALGVPVDFLGWSVRVLLLVASALVIWRPGALASAWTTRTKGRHGTSI